MPNFRKLSQCLFPIVVCFPVSWAQAQSLSHVIQSAVRAIAVPSNVGVLNGEVATETDFPGVVRVSIKDNATGKDTICSGFVIEGCVVTSRHCTGENSHYEIGTGPNGVFFSDVTELKRKEGKGHENDIAILKLRRPPSTALSSPRESIAEAPIAIDQDRNHKETNTVDIVGYGHVRVREFQGTKINDGAGKKHWGNVTVTSYGNVTNTGSVIENDGNNGDPTTPTMIFSNNYPQAVAPGDSGGPMIRNGKIYGIATFIIHRTAQKSEDQTFFAAPPEEKPFLITNIIRSSHISLAHGTEARKWLFENLDRLDCLGNTEEAVKVSIRDTLRDYQNHYIPLPQQENLFNDLALKIEKLRPIGNQKPLKVIEAQYNAPHYEIFFTEGNDNEIRPMSKLKVNMITGKIEFIDNVGVGVRTINRAELMKEEGTKPSSKKSKGGDEFNPLNKENPSPTDPFKKPSDPLREPVFRIPKERQN